MMSAKEILENIQYFLGTVLPNAYFSGKWDVDLLSQAFRWAEYCEKVFESAVDQPCASKLDSHIRAIGVALENGGSSPASLEYLKSSSEILCKALMQNNLIENSVYEAVLKKAKDKGCLEKLLQETTEMKAVFMALINTLSAVKAIDHEESFSQKLQVELQINDIEESIIQCSSKAEAEQVVSSYLESSFCDINKMRELLLLILKPLHDIQGTEKLQQLFLGELLKRINKKDSLYQSSVSLNVWNQSPSLLSSLASKSFQFFKCYIDFLVESACAMKPCYEDATVTWQASPSNLGTYLTFPIILLHLKQLLRANEKVCAATKALLISLASDPTESPVWHDVCHHFSIS